MIKTITLATLAEATPSEVFNFVAHHMLTQNQAAKVGEACKYRLGSLKCAAGCLIADAEYAECGEDFEGTDWPHLVRQHEVPAAHADLIRQTQIIHDNYVVESWPGLITKAAEDQGIKLEPEVQALIDLRSTK